MRRTTCTRTGSRTYSLVAHYCTLVAQRICDLACGMGRAWESEPNNGYIHISRNAARTPHQRATACGAAPSPLVPLPSLPPHRLPTPGCVAPGCDGCGGGADGCGGGSDGDGSGGSGDEDGGGGGLPGRFIGLRGAGRSKARDEGGGGEGRGGGEAKGGGAKEKKGVEGVGSSNASSQPPPTQSRALNARMDRGVSGARRGEAAGFRAPFNCG